jgi:hypothetical protein
MERDRRIYGRALQGAMRLFPMRIVRSGLGDGGDDPTGLGRLGPVEEDAGFRSHTVTLITIVIR